MMPEPELVQANESLLAEGKNVDLMSIVHVPEWKSLLFDLVKTHQMDPWAIDITDLAEKYLAKIQALEGLNLRVPANCMLSCAILLHLKAKRMHVLPFEEEEEMEEQFKQQRLNDHILEDFVPELKSPRMLREGSVTLDELVSTIEELLTNQKKYGNKFGKRPTEDIAFQIPFSESNMEEYQERVMKKIVEKKDSMGLCRFKEITAGLDKTEVVYHFLPLLFLCNKGKIHAWQEEFWGEIFISVNEN